MTDLAARLPLETTKATDCDHSQTTLRLAGERKLAGVPVWCVAGTGAAALQGAARR